MKRRDFIKRSGALMSTALVSSSLFDKCSPKKKKPNIIYVLADDLGYGELGCYGQKYIQTSHIDNLAKNGMKFTQHYSGSPVCAPSRCVLMTGKHTGHAYIRGNDEWGQRGDVWSYEKMLENPKLEGQRPIPSETVTLAEQLQKAGYQTACIGKWGLGPPFSQGSPNKQGFDYFFGYNCQRWAHTYYPPFLWENEERVPLNNKFVPLGTKLPENEDPYNPESYSDFRLNEYAPDLMLDKALNFLEKNENNPFFLYFPTTIPHVSLQVPKKYVDMYRDVFGDEEPYLGGHYFPCQYPKATYAGMITHLDEQVGQLVQKLKQIGEYENTVIIFTSDNGPTYSGGADTQFFNSAGIFGEKRGRGKGFTYEGGIRVPMIASWPGTIKPGTTSNHISAFWDVLPTLCELGSADTPEDTDGISFVPTLTQKKKQNHHAFLYWEFPAYNGQQAVRMARWKGIRKNIFKGNMKIELYNIDQDPNEQNDISDDHPDVLQRIEHIMKEQRTPPEIKQFQFPPLGD